MPDPFRAAPTHVLDPAVSPFKPGIGRVPPVFGGREEALGRAKVIVDRLAVGADPDFLLLRGLRGLGKTALMAYVRQRAEAVGVVCVHLEADRGLSDPAGVMGRLVEAVRDVGGAGSARRLLRRVDGVEIGTSGVKVSLDPDADLGGPLEAAVEAVGAAAAKAGRGVLVTVDEVQEAEDDLFRPLVRAMHFQSQEGHPVGLIGAGLPEAAQALLRESQTYTERIAAVELGLLSEAAVAEAVIEPFSMHGVEVDDVVIQAVMRASDGYPFFVQVWGSALWSSATRPDRVTADALPVARELVTPQVNAFHASRAARVPAGRGRVVVEALAALGGVASTGELLSASGLTNGQYAPARKALIDEGLLHAPRRGRVAFTVPGFAGWVDRVGPFREG